MSGIELDYWQLRDQVSPFGDRFDDWRMAAVSARIVQATIGGNQKIENHLAFKPEMYEEEKPITPREAMRRIREGVSE